jgi:hypothetical protein
MKFYIKLLIPRQIIILLINLQIIIYRLINKSYYGLENFPVDMYANNAFYKYPFFYDHRNETKYFAQFYREKFVTGHVFDIRSYANYTAEILDGEHITSDRFIFNNEVESLLPVSLPNKSTDEIGGSISVSINGEDNTLQGLKYNSFHYFPIKIGKIEVKSEKNFIVCRPIANKQNLKHNKKLVITIFIDGLSSKIITENNISKLMPYTNKFFSKGSKYFNCIATSEWTLPSVASITSGLYAINHGITKARGKIEVGIGYKLLAEYFQDNEYLTAQFCSNHRKNPYYGYMKGFDRTVYKQHMDCHEVITSAIEHLHTFNQRDNYIWLSFFDIHHHLNNIPDISSQKFLDIKYHTYKKNVLNSPFLSYDEKLIKWHESEANRLDLYIQMLYSYIQQNYNNEDVLISLVSDHGQAYAGTQKDLLSEQKLTTPLMFVGGGIDQLTSNNIVQNIDYLPTLLSMAGINNNLNLDGHNIHKDYSQSKDFRNFSFSESIYPDRRYQVSIYDKYNLFYLTSNNKLDSMDEFKLSDCKYKLVRRLNGEDITLENNEICLEYLNYINKHVNNSL